MTRFGLFLGLLSACEIDVPLLHDPPKGQDAGGAADAGRSCQGDQDCLSGMHCVKAICGGAGVCVRMQPLGCAGASILAYEPVCGCDDVTYFNWCLAAARGIAIKVVGECPPQGHCFEHCAPPGFCTRLSCDPGPDLCYAFPPSCPDLAARSCRERRCVDLCQSIPNSREGSSFELGCP